MNESGVATAQPNASIATLMRLALLAGMVSLLVILTPSHADAAYGLRPIRVSGTSLTPTNHDSFFGSMSSGGRFVAFQSFATNLASGGGSSSDIFVRDMRSGAVRCASIAANGATPNGMAVSPTISAAGQFVAFASNASNLVADDTNGSWDVFYRNMANSSVMCASLGGNGDSASPVISANGRRIAFVSSASNLVAGDAAGRDDIFVYDLVARTIKRVSVGLGGSEANGDSSAPSINADGTKVAFVSRATNLVTGDTNGRPDVFVVDVSSLAMTRVSVRGTSTQANLSSFAPAISGNGRKVAFESLATNLVSGDTNEVRDIFVRDLWNRSTVRASVSSGGSQGNGESREPSISHYGTRVVFSSSATNLATGDTNARADVFMRKLDAPSTSRLSVPPSGQGNAVAAGGVISADAVRVLYQTTASNIDSYDYNKRSDLIVASFGKRTYDRVQGKSVYSTAVQASRRTARWGSDAVVVTNSSDWRAALAASSLAGAVRGPVLYVGKTWLPSDTRSEIARLRAKRVYVVGGSGSVSGGVYRAIQAIPGVAKVERVGSGDSYSVTRGVASKVVSLKGSSFDGTVLVVSGKSPATAITAAPLAAGIGRPIVFVSKTGRFTLPWRTKRAIVFGSKRTVSSRVARKLQGKLGKSRVSRWSRSDRYALASIAAKRTVSRRHGWDRVTVVNVAKPIEAISGATMAGRMGSVVLYSSRTSASRTTRVRLKASKYRIDTVYIFGTTKSIGSRSLRSIKKALGG